MKKTISCLLFIVLLATVFSCRPKPMPALLLAADSLASANPDSALTLLARVEDSLRQAPDPVRMYYNLLTVKTQDKAYILHTSDSLIRTVVDYYEHKNNHTYLPEAYYYAGRVYRDLNAGRNMLTGIQFEENSASVPILRSTAARSRIKSTGTGFMAKPIRREISLPISF